MRILIVPPITSEPSFDRVCEVHAIMGTTMDVDRRLDAKHLITEVRRLNTLRKQDLKPKEVFSDGHVDVWA